LVRKRLVPFLISDGLSNGTTNDTSFDELKTPLFEQILLDLKAGKGFRCDFSNGQRVKPGFRLFKNIGSSFDQYKDETAIGDVILTNHEGTLGLAMVQLDTLHSHAKDFVVLNMPRDDTEEGVDQPTKKGDSVVRFVGTFRPLWFQGLDTKTNIKV
jgi:hypothetical protein